MENTKKPKAGIVDVDRFFDSMPSFTVKVDQEDAIQHIREATLPLTERVTALDQLVQDGSSTVIQEKEGEYFIYDRATSTGTYVRPKGRQGFRPVGNAYKLQHGDTISVGLPQHGKRLLFRRY